MKGVFYRSLPPGGKVRLTPEGARVYEIFFCWFVSVVAWCFSQDKHTITCLCTQAPSTTAWFPSLSEGGYCKTRFQLQRQHNAICFSTVGGCKAKKIPLRCKHLALLSPLPRCQKFDSTPFRSGWHGNSCVGERKKRTCFSTEFLESDTLKQRKVFAFLPL